jgi:hypothetical protein
MDGSISRWFDREIAGCSLADRRLTKRLRSLLERMGDAMGASIPLALPGLGEHQGRLPLLFQSADQ